VTSAPVAEPETTRRTERNPFLKSFDASTAQQSSKESAAILSSLLLPTPTFSLLTPSVFGSLTTPLDLTPSFPFSPLPPVFKMGVNKPSSSLKPETPPIASSRSDSEASGSQRKTSKVKRAKVTGDDSAERRKALNRDASARCRMRKLTQIESNTEGIRLERQKGDTLRATLSQLEADISLLRTQVLEHQVLGCSIAEPGKPSSS
jgi:hypothetical protein